MRKALVFSVILVVLAFGGAAAADETSDARDAFTEGLDLVAKEQWAYALAAFERAQKLKPHALTLYNMGIAEQHLGHLTRARVDFVSALDVDSQNGHTQLASSFADATTGLVRDLDTRIVYLDVTIEPHGSLITVDGRPLVVDPTARSKVYYAGIAGATSASPDLPDSFTMAVDPGQREILLQKEGFEPQPSNETYPAGKHADLRLSLTAREATIHVDADRKEGVVYLGGKDMGAVPVTLKRSPGPYALEVRCPGFVTYKAAGELRPGGRIDIQATLPQESISIARKWWFWTAIGAVVVGTGVTAYLVTRPAPPYDGGNTGWVAQPR